MQQLALTPAPRFVRVPEPREALPDTPLGILAWLDRYAIRIELQELKAGSRQKNRVILQYRDAGGLEVVGGTTLVGAVIKAELRRRAAAPSGIHRKAN